MTTIITRSGKGSPLTNTELDNNFINLDTDKIESKVTTISSGATIEPASDNTQYNVTALAVGSVINAPTGTPVGGWKMLLRIKDDGTSRSLSWNAIYRGIGVTLPTSTTAGKVMYLGMTYNSTDTKWDVNALMIEA